MREGFSATAYILYGNCNLSTQSKESRKSVSIFILFCHTGCVNLFTMYPLHSFHCHSYVIDRETGKSRVSTDTRTENWMSTRTHFKGRMGVGTCLEASFQLRSLSLEYQQTDNRTELVSCHVHSFSCPFEERVKEWIKLVTVKDWTASTDWFVLLSSLIAYSW